MDIERLQKARAMILDGNMTVGAEYLERASQNKWELLTAAAYAKQGKRDIALGWLDDWMNLNLTEDEKVYIQTMND